MFGTARVLQYPGHKQLLCPICNKPVKLETAKSDEGGKAIHEECYLSKLSDEAAPELKRA
jgi:hypothetical protein